MADAHAPAGKYYVPHSSKWPIIASASFFTLLLGAVALLNHWLPACGWAMLPGFALVVYMFIGWFSHRHRREPAAASTASTWIARSAWE